MAGSDRGGSRFHSHRPIRRLCSAAPTERSPLIFVEQLLGWPTICLPQYPDKEMNMQRKASAHWQGDLKTGKGSISTESGVLSKTQYSFSTRFENGIGTNPEELIGAAHAGCFSMALSGQLGSAGMTAESIDTTATVTMEKLDAGFTVTKVHLEVRAKIPGADPAAFDAAANRAKTGCPISRLLNATITMDAKLN